MSSVKRLLAVLLCAGVLMAAVSAVPSGLFSAVAETSADLQAQLDAAKAESNAIAAEIAALEKANAPYEQQKAALNKQIANTQKEIDLYQSKIDALTNSIAALEKEIAKTEQSLKRAVHQFKQRLVSIYVSGDLHTGLELLGNSDDVAAALAKLELMDSVSRKDSEAMQNLLDAIDKLESERVELDEQQKDLASSQDIIKQKKADLSAQYTKVNSIVTSNKSEIAALEKKEASYKQMEKDIAEALERKKREESGELAVGTGQFAWPVPGYYKLSEKYGPRICPIHGKENHGGIDISSSGIYGAKIVAADDGEILLAKWYGGYGNCVMIDHNNGYVTLYGHMKAASPLKVGDTVVKGKTVIGYVGSTGDSTGPHLHFEIRKNGSTIDPMSFF